MAEWSGPHADRDHSGEVTPEWLAEIQDLPSEQSRIEYAEHLLEELPAKPKPEPRDPRWTRAELLWLLAALLLAAALITGAVITR